jgi:hypothetical protein
MLRQSYAGAACVSWITRLWASSFHSSHMCGAGMRNRSKQPIKRAPSAKANSVQARVKSSPRTNRNGHAATCAANRLGPKSSSAGGAWQWATLSSKRIGVLAAATVGSPVRRENRCICLRDLLELVPPFDEIVPAVAASCGADHPCGILGLRYRTAGAIVSVSQPVNSV